jgi:hypothetical protein
MPHWLIWASWALAVALVVLLALFVRWVTAPVHESHPAEGEDE